MLNWRAGREKQCVLVLATPEGRRALKARKIGAVCCSIWNGAAQYAPRTGIAHGVRKAAGEILPVTCEQLGALARERARHAAEESTERFG